MNAPQIEQDIQPPLKKTRVEENINNNQVDIEIPNNLKDSLYDVVWFKKYTWPCLIINTTDLSNEELEKYNSSSIEDKVPIRYFCDTDNNEYILFYLVLLYLKVN